MCLLCSVLVNINQPKNIIKYLRILIIKFEFDKKKFCVFYPVKTLSKRFQAIKKNCVLTTVGGGVPRPSSTTKKKKFSFVSSFARSFQNKTFQKIPISIKIGKPHE